MAVLHVLFAVLGFPHALRVAVTVSAVLPPLVASVIVLSQTPRTHLEYEESVLGHFASRFMGLASAVVLWMGSVVLGAAVAGAAR